MRPTRSRPFPAAVVVAVVAAALAGAVPVLAHDESVGGTPDVTVTLGSAGVSDREVRIGSGSVVRFLNRDDDRHRVRARSGPAEFDSGNLESGEWFQVRLTAAGTYAYADERDRDDRAYQGRIVVAAPAGGAGGETGGGGSGATSGAAGGATGGGGAPPTSNVTVTIGDDFFDPGSVRVSVGGSVAFQNRGEDEHSATSTAFDTGVLAGGAAATETFPTAGTFDFLCIFHSDMRGTVEVVGTAPAAPAAPSPTPVPSASATPSATPAPAATEGPAPDAVTGPVEVDIVDFAFEAADVVVGAGGTVVWRNSGVAPHTATADDGSWDSGMLATGDTFEQTFETLGHFTYLCAIHPDMTGTIEVIAEAAAPVSTPSAAAAAVASSPPSPAAALDLSDASVEAVDRSDAAGAPASDVSGLAGIVLTVTFVSVAAALFSRAIRGTVRQPE